MVISPPQVRLDENLLFAGKKHKQLRLEPGW